MKRWLLVLVLPVVSTRIAHADDPLYTCRTPPADTKITVTFKPEVSLHDLVTWAMGFTCKNIVFESSVAKYATKVTIIAPNKYTPKQAMQLFVDAIQSTGLVVTQTPDTITIKLGPNMPRNCPDATPSSSSTQAPRPATPPPVAEPEITDAEIDAGIKEIDVTHYEITRALVDKITANPMASMRGMRVVAAVKNGKPDGFTLYAITHSLWSKLGFANGDTLRTINKLKLDTADAALETYAKLRAAKRLEVELERRGAPVTIVIVVK